ncbi:MAG: type II secretion system protein [Sedimentisphaerales bacterium]|jgi:prepilin-type N-terminal cleavage/methylation domain-containing protein/prepilin-type processing-associated H-X9-DG protein
MKRKHAFTLIELLVVISIIALLMGIILPALNIARDQGRRASCMSNMRQVGMALVMYQNEYEKTPPKTQAVFDYASPAAPDNVLKLLRPFAGAEEPNRATPVYACPALKPNPNPAYAPSRVSRTGYLVNAVVMGRQVAAIPSPGRIIAMQEGWSLSNHLWVQPEPIIRNEATLSGRAYTPYQEWHMFASQSDHSSWFTKERREQTANVHNKGGNFIFCDGHADYRKYWDRESGDYGLINATTGKSVPYEPTRENTTMTLDAAF